jgi:hypothetical protein
MALPEAHPDAAARTALGRFNDGQKMSAILATEPFAFLTT